MSVASCIYFALLDEEPCIACGRSGSDCNCVDGPFVWPKRAVEFISKANDLAGSSQEAPKA